jgi:hypothetical protein
MPVQIYHLIKLLMDFLLIIRELQNRIKLNMAMRISGCVSKSRTLPRFVSHFQGQFFRWFS